MVMARNRLWRSKCMDDRHDVAGCIWNPTGIEAAKDFWNLIPCDTSNHMLTWSAARRMITNVWRWPDAKRFANRHSGQASTAAQSKAFTITFRNSPNMNQNAPRNLA